MADGLSLDPAEFDPGPLAVRGQVHIDSGTNIARVIGLTPNAFANVTGPVFFGLNVAGPAAPFFMTAAQSTAVLNLFTSGLQGLVPASGGGTTNFLRADGTWAAPAGGGGGSQGWDDTLAIDAHSGANNPIIDNSQHLRFGTAAPSSATTGEIRSDAGLHLHADTTIDIQAHDAIHIFGPDAVLIESTAGSDVTLRTSTDVVLDAGDDVVLIADDQLNAAGAVSAIVTGGGNGLSATAASFAMAAGTTGVIGNASTTLVFRTNNISRLTLGTAGGWTISGTEGTAGQYLRSAGAGATPTWASLALSELPSQAADTFLGRLAGAGSPVAQNLADLDSTSLIFDATSHTFQVAAASGGDITKAQNSNTYTINNDAVTYAKIQNVVNNNRFLGRISGAGGDVEELTGTQATTLLDNFTSALKGLAPASGGGTANFLRADGTWAVPAGTFTALSGAVTSGGTGGATLFAGILDNTVAENNRTNLNFANGTNTTGTVTDDSVNDRLTIQFNVDNYPLSGLADQPANTIVANATAGSAAPTALAIAADSLPARVGGNLVSHPWSTLAGNGLTYAAGVLAVGAGTGILSNANDVAVNQAANFTWTGIHQFDGTYVEIGTNTGSLPAAGDIRKEGTLSITSGPASAGMTLQCGLSALWEAIGGDMSMRSSGYLDLDATDNVVLNGDAVVVTSGTNTPGVGGTLGGFLMIRESAASTPSVLASHGMLSVDSGVVPNELRYTDEANADWRINTCAVAGNTSIQSITNSTTAITGASFTIPANTLRIGSTYKLEGIVQVTRGATATAANLVMSVVLAGTTYCSTSTPIFTGTNATGQSYFTFYIVCFQSGATGLFIANGQVIGDIAQIGGAHSAAEIWRLATGTYQTTTSGTSKDTTTALALSVTASMSAAVSALTARITHCVITKMI